MSGGCILKYWCARSPASVGQVPVAPRLFLFWLLAQVGRGCPRPAAAEVRTSCAFQDPHGILAANYANANVNDNDGAPLRLCHSAAAGPVTQRDTCDHAAQCGPPLAARRRALEETEDCASRRHSRYDPPPCVHPALTIIVAPSSRSCCFLNIYSMSKHI